MNITVKFFALGRELVGASAVTLTLEEGASVEDVLTRLQAEHPNFAKLPSFLTAVNTRYTERTMILSNNDELAIIPPVSGG
jgi:molybdopterin synthase sulfur carrier subunit